MAVLMGGFRHRTPKALRVSSGLSFSSPGMLSFHASSDMRPASGSKLKCGLGSAFNHLKSSI